MASWPAGTFGPRSCDSCGDSNGLHIGFTCFAGRVERSRASVLLPDHTQRLEVGATLYETRNRAPMRLLEAALKWVGITLLLISCAMLVYLGYWFREATELRGTPLLRRGNPCVRIIRWAIGTQGEVVANRQGGVSQEGRRGGGGPGARSPRAWV